MKSNGIVAALLSQKRTLSSGQPTSPNIGRLPEVVGVSSRDVDSTAEHGDTKDIARPLQEDSFSEAIDLSSRTLRRRLY